MPSTDLPWYTLCESDTSIKIKSASPLAAICITSSTFSVCFTAKPPRLVRILEKTRALTKSSSTIRTVFIRTVFINKYGKYRNFVTFVQRGTRHGDYIPRQKCRVFSAISREPCKTRMYILEPLALRGCTDAWKHPVPSSFRLLHTYSLVVFYN